MSKIINKIKNNIAICMAIFLIMSVIYYAICYFNNSKKIVFSEADIVILFLLAICILCVSLCMIISFSKNKILICLIVSIKENIEKLIEINEVDKENNISLHFVNQDILLKIKSDINRGIKSDINKGVDCSHVETTIRKKSIE